MTNTTMSDLDYGNPTGVDITYVQEEDWGPDDLVPTQESPSQSFVALDGVLFRIAITFAALGSVFLVISVVIVLLHWGKYRAHKRIERHIRARASIYNNPIDILVHEDLLVAEIHNRTVEYGAMASGEVKGASSPSNGRCAIKAEVPRLEFIQPSDGETDGHHSAGNSENQFSNVSLEV